MRELIPFLTFLLLSLLILARPERPVLHLVNFSADKNLYHSAELVNLSLTVYSGADLENVSIILRGINNRLNRRKIVSLNKGINTFYFTYRLPRCNVCGGIRPGSYEITCVVAYRDIKLVNSTKIEIRQ